MNKITTIKGVFPAKRKDGTLISGNSPKTGEPWQLWNITDADDTRYSGFNIPKEIQPGVQAFIEYETEQSGKFTNNKIVNIAAVKGTPSQPQSGVVGAKKEMTTEEKVEILWKEHEERVDFMERMVQV